VSGAESCLDLSRLEKLRHASGKITARCPACAEAGGDRRGDHLAILPSGKFACAAMPGDGEHRRRIFALVGIAGDSKPSDGGKWREREAKERHARQRRERLIAAVKSQRAKILARHQWEPADVWESSPQRIDCHRVEECPRHFLASLFPADARLWTGEVFESGERHARRWRTVAEWREAPGSERIGPMVSPAIWQAGSTSRAASAVLCSPYTVLDFDGFDGVKPDSPKELAAHVLASLALVRWMREALSWRLAALLWTGNKSVHAWFHTPPEDALAELRDAAGALGLDAGLIGRPEHPCRLPGHAHPRTGGKSRVLWLQGGGGAGISGRTPMLEHAQGKKIAL